MDVHKAILLNQTDKHIVGYKGLHRYESFLENGFVDGFIDVLILQFSEKNGFPMLCSNIPLRWHLPENILQKAI